MANKRELKKFICNTCGSLAADMVNLAELFPQIDAADVQRIVVATARLQASTLSRMGVAFDRTPRDFETKAAYNAARNVYFREAYTALLDTFDKGVAELVKEMNAAIPADVREVLKKAAAQ